jgi:putative ferrous iron transport protein C
MILTELRDYLSVRKRASVTEMADRFAIEPLALEGLLAAWIAKGRVRRLKDQLPCGTCGKCESAVSDIYEWVGINGCPDPAMAGSRAAPLDQR